MVLEDRHLGGLVRNRVGQLVRDDDALGIAADDVAREDRRVAAADRLVDGDGLVQGQVGRRTGARVVGREAWAERLRSG